MAYYQTLILLPPHSRGIHIITPYITDALNNLLPNNADVGMVHLFLQHTSASLSINENADPDVRLDTEDWLNNIAPADQPQYRHTLEGSDDLPAHFKSMMLGISLNIPLVDGKLGLGRWQGVYFCEHRDYASGRQIVMTLST